MSVLCRLSPERQIILMTSGHHDTSLGHGSGAHERSVRRESRECLGTVRVLNVDPSQKAGSCTQTVGGCIQPRYSPETHRAVYAVFAIFARY